MNINRENYEIYVVDFLDGNISEKDKRGLELFLKENPDIWKEVQDLDTTFLSPETIPHPNKAALKQALYKDEAYFDEMAVAYLENDIDPLEKSEFETLIAKDETKRKIFDIFALTKLKPDLSIIFPDKKSLYHKAKFIPLYVRFGQIAAVAAMFLLALLLYNPWGNRNFQHLAQQRLVQGSNSITFNIDTHIDVKPENNESLILKQVSDKNETIKQTQNTEIIAKHNPINQQDVLADASRAYRSPIENEDPFDQENTFESLKPKKPEVGQYLLVLKPTLTPNEGNSTVKRRKPLETFAQTGEKLLKSGSQIERKQVEKGLLNVLKLASNDRINYETNDKGKVSKIKLNSELLAFTLPLRKNQ